MGGHVQTVAVDFDGVIHAYSRGWQDGTIYDEPMPGAIEGIRALQRRYAVFIFTSREPEQVMPWLEQWFDVTIDERCGRCHGGAGMETADDAPWPGHTEASCKECKGNGLLGFWNSQEQLLVTNRKLPAVAYVDDRAVRFTAWPRALADLGVDPAFFDGDDQLLSARLLTQAIPCDPELAAALTGNTAEAVRAEHGDMVWVDMSIRGPIGMRPGRPDPQQQRRDVAEIFADALRHVRVGSVGPVDWAAAAAQIGAQPEPCADHPMLFAPSCPRCAFERSLAVHPGVPEDEIYVGDPKTGTGVRVRGLGADHG